MIMSQRRVSVTARNLARFREHPCRARLAPGGALLNANAMLAPGGLGKPTMTTISGGQQHLTGLADEGSN